MTQNIGTLLLPGPAPPFPPTFPPWSIQEHLIKLFQSFRRSGNCQWKRTAWQGRRQPHKNPFRKSNSNFWPCGDKVRVSSNAGQRPIPWQLSSRAVDHVSCAGLFSVGAFYQVISEPLNWITGHIEICKCWHNGLPKRFFVPSLSLSLYLVENPEMRWENNNSGKLLQAVC